ncbi:MAG TPA: branched-chain amino acid ABC transporter permease [Symbiobacteriaceae bacterium]
MSLGFLLQLVFTGLTMGSIYALVAIGYNLIYATTGIINFSQGELVMMGGMVGLAAVTALGLPPHLAILVSLAVVSVLALAVYRIAWQPLSRRQSGGSRLGWILSTIGIGIVIQNVAMLLWGKEFHPLPALVPDGNLRLGELVINSVQAFVLLAAILLAVLTELLLNYTFLGKAFKATSFNAEAAAYMGINTPAMVGFSFALAGALAALAGFLVSPLTFASSVLGLIVGLKGFGAAVLGGLGSNRGAMVGGLILGVMEIISGTFITAGFRDITAFLLIILVLVMRPQGLLGQPVTEKA